jgi:hypothetical protein
MRRRYGSPQTGKYSHMKIQMPQLCFTFEEARRALAGCNPDRRTPALANYEEISFHYLDVILQLLKESLLQVAAQDLSDKTTETSLEYKIAMAELTYFNAWFGSQSLSIAFKNELYSIG